MYVLNHKESLVSLPRLKFVDTKHSNDIYEWSQFEQAFLQKKRKCTEHIIDCLYCSISKGKAIFSKQKEKKNTDFREIKKKKKS